MAVTSQQMKRWDWTEPTNRVAGSTFLRRGSRTVGMTMITGWVGVGGLLRLPECLRGQYSVGSLGGKSVTFSTLPTSFLHFTSLLPSSSFNSTLSHFFTVTPTQFPDSNRLSISILVRVSSSVPDPWKPANLPRPDSFVAWLTRPRQSGRIQTFRTDGCISEKIRRP
jgi:hypothetical protein